MRTTTWMTAALGAAVMLGAAGCSGAAANGPAASPAERGKYLVTVMACGDCHTPLKMGANGPEPDMSRFLSGHPEAMQMPAPPATSDAWGWVGAATNTAFAGPWGVSYAANLTSDRNTGLGAWTEQMFVDALRTGRHMGTSRPIAPPMPWPAYSTATDADLRAVYAYLKTVPPVVNHVPDYQPPVPTH